MMRILERRLTKAYCGTFAASVTARVLQVLVAVICARRLGPEGFGVFTFATGTGVLAGELAAQGWPLLMSRFIPPFRDTAKWESLRGLLKYADAFVACGSTVMAVFLLLLSKAAGQEEYAAGLALSALIVPPIAFCRLRRQQYAAFGKPVRGLTLDEMSGPFAVVVIALASSLDDAATAIIWFALGSALAASLSTVLFRRSWPKELAQASPAADLKLWTTIAAGGLLATFSRLVLGKLDVLMIAPLSSLHEAGIYGAALRVTYLMVFPQVVLTTVLTPTLSSAFMSRDLSLLHQRYLFGLMVAVLTALPIALMVFFFSSDILLLAFGTDFESGATVLAILTLAQAFNSVAIPGTSLLLMTGREWFVGRLYIILLILSALGNLLLVPRYGGLAVAAVMLFGAIVAAIVQALEIRRFFRVEVA